MTRPSKSSLVLDGSQVKIRLEAERVESKTPVHVDWVRFTCLLRNSVTPSADVLFPQALSVWDENYRDREFARILAELHDGDFAAAAQAHELALEVAKNMGPDFKVAQDLRKGHDFYKFRWAIERNTVECGWIGFGASSKKEAQQAQAKTLHVNLFGSATTFAAPGWNFRIADLVDARKADLTRCDLALDFFDGLREDRDSMEGILADYRAGVMNSGGKKLKSNCVGDWANGCERSFYIGNKESGKQTNIYEKGHQLFGREGGSSWLRIELRYGNKLRVLSADMLRRPADFFAGASDWHALMLTKADAIVQPEPIKARGKLAVQTVQAEVTRTVRWAFQTAAPTVAVLFQYLGDEFLELVTGPKLPGRLKNFSKAELQEAFATVFRKNSSVDGTGHAFA